MRCLVFGATGLIGSHLIPLISKEYTVLTVGVHKNNTYQIDLGKEWKADLFPERIDNIIYLAQSLKFRDFPNAAEEIFWVNNLSLLKALDYARRARARSFIYTSSGGVYEKSNEVYEENAPLNPQGSLGFYIGTKMCGEIIANNYTPFMNIVVLRPFIVYGPGQRKEMLIPRLVERVNNGLPIHLVGKEGVKINPTFVEDAAQAVKQAMELKESRTINVGGPEILSMRQIGEQIGQALGKSALFEEKEGSEEIMAGCIQLMSEKLWTPLINFSKGIKLYVDSLKSSSGTYV